MKIKNGLQIFFLRPGEIHFTGSPCIVSTILGSCVSVTMFHRRTGTASICHALLPEFRRSNDTEGFRFVDYSLSYMFSKFDAKRIPRYEIEVKLFGGSDMFGRNERSDNYVTIGRQNIREALFILENENMLPVASDIGGYFGRKIYFFTGTGEVFLKHLGK